MLTLHKGISHSVLAKEETIFFLTLIITLEKKLPLKNTTLPVVKT